MKLSIVTIFIILIAINVNASEHKLLHGLKCKQVRHISYKSFPMKNQQLKNGPIYTIRAFNDNVMEVHNDTMGTIKYQKYSDISYGNSNEKWQFTEDYLGVDFFNNRAGIKNQFDCNKINK